MKSVGRRAFKALAWLYGERPLPVSAVRLTRRLALGDDPLLPPAWLVGTSSTAIRNSQLRDRLASQELGGMALGARTINLLEREVRRLRPELVLEFGSGISTLCLAQFMFDVHGPGGGIRVLSIDQDERYATVTRGLLQEAGVADAARVVACPLSQQTIEGFTANCYTMPPAGDLREFEGRAGMVLVDGPAAENGARFGTLPLGRAYAANGARFMLDDALRDGELDTMRRWSRLPYVRVQGLRVVEKGILVGLVNP
jgi:hypothetical protein